ncbi:P-loop containing nucleoside triphosphate hydrolase protein [Aspergillus ibericus CBS 121593]|uniref:P-loop containing nucleoside triphosphate hydrolase protein n=1 Tax=Aspergillus ibericus CBS 121593 TaxID=1448316 RepID=A0A395GTU6_9EURO|nr:P-loop containing nucleoside triphosphate hydrolase protein [Aspergillus ibericus CBS 121593]RAK98866.1 P-loop containing nucleoside triphosphate hydrolase protein [Aspergillus ibericus CBS 121593]
MNSTTIKQERQDAGWPDECHIAVVGATGAGKSSFVNALRGIRNGHPGAAPVGTSGTTREVHRYLGYNSDDFWIHDVHGVGTESVEAAGYFSAYNLRLYDCVLVVYSDQRRAVDLRILEACDYRHVPVCLVRTQSDQSIRNIVYNYGMALADAMEILIEDILGDINSAFHAAELPDKLQQSVFLVKKNGLYSSVTGCGGGKYGINEQYLVKKLSSVNR